MIEEFLTEKLVIFNTVAGISIMGVILDELGDSFIVGLPARLIREEGNLKCEPYAPAPLTRFFKGTLLNYVPLDGTFEVPYLNYVLNKKDEIELSSNDEGEVNDRLSKLLADQSSDVLELPSRITYVFPDVESIH